MLQIKDNTIFDWPVVLFVDAYGGVVAALDGGFSQSMKSFVQPWGIFSSARKMPTLPLQAIKGIKIPGYVVFIINSLGVNNKYVVVSVDFVCK